MDSDESRWSAMQPDENPNLLSKHVSAYLDWMAVQNYSSRSIQERKKILLYFIKWCLSTGVEELSAVQRSTIEGWQLTLHQHQKKGGGALSIGVQHNRLVQLQAFFTWLLRKNHIPSNPASDLELPRLPRRLPLTILSPQDVEMILEVPDTSTSSGLRDKALLELLYSTGVRRKEAAELTLASIDWHRSVLKVCHGKGGKDRVIPVGQRALHWLRRYLDQARPALNSTDSSLLFVNNQGGPFSLNGLGNLVHRYITQTGGVTSGSCHVFRHAMATAMLDNGADIRFVQEMLGHQRLETTQLYTHVSIEKLKSVNRATHPAERDWSVDAPARAQTLSAAATKAEARPTLEAVTAETTTSIRQSLGLNETEFGRLLNLSVSSLRRLERGQSQAKGPLLRLLQILRRNASLGREIHLEIRLP